MIKCKVCNSRKGKRICIFDNQLICSECCGKTRREDLCYGCSYYAPSTKRYQDVPRFSPGEMSENLNLQTLSNTIESAICSLDFEKKKILNDLVVIEILERLLDKYYLKMDQQKIDDDLVKSGFLFVDNIINNDLKGIDNLTLVKILSVIRFVAKRRTTGKREYIDFINQYVGKHVGPGIRLMDF